jgi:hypothetical protein
MEESGSVSVQIFTDPDLADPSHTSDPGPNPDPKHWLHVTGKCINSCYIVCKDYLPPFVSAKKENHISFCLLLEDINLRNLQKTTTNKICELHASTLWLYAACKWVVDSPLRL